MTASVSHHAEEILYSNINFIQTFSLVSDIDVEKIGVFKCKVNFLHE